jgi:hypothetical protein
VKNNTSGIPMPANNGLVGLFIHKFEDGKIIEQGRIIGLDQHFVLVELHSWLDGSPTCVVAWTRKEIYSDQCRLYGGPDSWNEAVEKEARETGAHL